MGRAEVPEFSTAASMPTAGEHPEFNRYPCRRVRARRTGRTTMNRRILTKMSLLGLAVAFATASPQIGFAQSNPWIGTWKANVAKSTYSPGPPPRSQTVTWQAEALGLRLTVEAIDAQGNPTKVVSVIFD